jgi:tetrahydromethanopterin S-methyltransferase subunit G
MDENDFKRLLEESAAETHRRMDERFDQVDARAAETNARVEKVEARTAELKQHIDNIAAEMKQDFGVAVEDMRTDVQRVAESVLMVNAKLDREAADIRAEMRQGFAETQALLRFSHGRLDDRVTALERAAK